MTDEEKEDDVKTEETKSNKSLTIDELKEINCNKDIRNVLQYPVKKFFVWSNDSSIELNIVIFCTLLLIV
jgi:hypothetical protein